MGLRGINARPIAIKPTEEVLANRDPHPWEKEGLSRAERVAVFLETLPVTSGNKRGTKFRVRDWQWKDIIEPIYRTDANGRRYVREAVISMGRKNGKTGLVAGLSLCHLVGPEAVERGQVLAAANAKKQSTLMFNEVEAIATRVPWIQERLNIQRFMKKMEDIGITGSTFAALAADAPTEYGLSAYFWVFDELGQAKDDELYKAMSTSGGAWEEPLGIVISTQAAISRHIMSELIDDCLQINKGVVDDPSRYGCIYTAPLDADPWSEETWKLANPAMGDFRSVEDLRDYAKKAQRMPSMAAAFRNLYLNQRVSSQSKFIPPDVWASAGQTPAEFDAASLRGRECFGGLDLSGHGHGDLTALVLVFQMDDGLKKILPFFWMNEEGLEEAENRDRVPYRQWANEGHVLLAPSRALKYDYIATKIAELATVYSIKLIAVDPHNINDMAAHLDRIGANLTMQKHDQHHAGMEPGLRVTEADVLSGKLKHNKNSVLTWCMDNVDVSMDSSGNRKFDKRKATGRIDGAVALAMCESISEAITVEPTYEVIF